MAVYLLVSKAAFSGGSALILLTWRSLAGCGGFDFPADSRAFGVVGFLIIMLGLKTDEKVSRSAKTGLKAQCDGGAHTLALTNDIAELCGADVHGISEENLFKEGRDAAEVFHEFARFAEGAVLVGHNVGFDLSMIRAHSARLGDPLPTGLWDDTLDLARRLLNIERYDLSTVSDHLKTRTRPSHRALADARPTSEILLELGHRLETGAPLRRELVSRHGALFLPVARQLDSTFGSTTNSINDLHLKLSLVNDGPVTILLDSRLRE